MANPVYGLRPRGPFLDQKSGKLSWEATKWLESLLLQANTQANAGDQTMIAPMGAYARSGGAGLATPVGAYADTRSTLPGPVGAYGGAGGLPVPMGSYS